MRGWIVYGNISRGCSVNLIVCERTVVPKKPKTDYCVWVVKKGLSSVKTEVRAPFYALGKYTFWVLVIKRPRNIP